MIARAMLCLFSIGGMLLLLGGWHQENPSKSTTMSEVVKVQAKSARFEINGLKAPSEPNDKDYETFVNTIKNKAHIHGPLVSSLGTDYIDVITYSYISCEANWNETCQGDFDFTASPRYQMCKMLYTIQSQNNSAYITRAPGGWYEGDTESPPRFRSYHLYVFAGGSHNPVNQWGSNIYLTNVGMRLILSGYTNYDRYVAGCDMPPKPKP